MFKCKVCEQPLVIELDAESFDEATSSSVGQASSAPDDLLLMCGCHFHWQCLLDESPQIALDLACPSCQRSIVTTAPGPSATNSHLPPASPQPLILTRYHNEGGVQENLDILPLITEEAYLDANPAARPARAFMTMCGEGDVARVIELLTALQQDPEEGDMSPSELLRFQDPLDGMKTGLHVAIERSQQEAVWMLLWLASGLPSHVFPSEVVQAAESMEASRGTAEGGVDIRRLSDGEGRTGEDVAKGMGAEWAGLLGAGVLRV
ncbi:uncharacterized protein L3040_005604 [Drepanopeziza brunnea f. sp. 'multigermtubi']|uniref:uncharacterized protein n=1 Tax=Drepanopeziza brunnea f. sp. 'multigermtubi' TaxID=698441 RepID=UPI002398D035|nr:hypothetical protein L3040_005604 [Drepanopeziza brunnea f. sp. 'multigermtubi']